MMFAIVEDTILELSSAFGAEASDLRYAACLLLSFGFNLALVRIPRERINQKCL